MPKGGDPLCPLGFHPQVRWPNRCKRCFRDYNEHKVSKDTGSSTSLNSLSSYDPNTNTFSRRGGNSDYKESSSSGYGSRESLVSSSRVKNEDESVGSHKKYTRSYSDLTSSVLARSNSEDRQDEESSGSSRLSSWNKARPVSWSAQDLRQAVDDAKEKYRTSPDDQTRLYGSTKSLTAQDLDDRSSKDSDSKLSEDNDVPSYSSFSSYLAMRTKSPARPPLGRTSSLTGTSSTSSSARQEEEEEEKPLMPKSILTNSTSSTTKPETKLFSTSSSKKDEGEPEKEDRLSRLGIRKTLSSISEAKPPKPPVRVKEKAKTDRLPEIRETSSNKEEKDKPKKLIQSLREVKSEDDSVDATYVIQLKPKKRVEIDLQPEVDRLQREISNLESDLKSMKEKNEKLEEENKDILSKKPSKFGDLRRQSEITKLQQKLEELQEDHKSKNKEVKDLKKEIEKRPLPKDVEKTMDDLRSKLQAAEQLCEELMDEIEDYKKDVRALEEEIEEMQDNFREEQADEYRDLKRELEQTAKNCRVLQFKLKKAERRSDQLEKSKLEAEEKLKELQVGESDIERAERTKTLERELSLAKEISVKMNEDMEKMKSQLEEAEVDKKKLTEKVNEKPKPGAKYSRAQMMGRQGSQDNSDQLMRDLQDSLEREQDIKEQLKFAEEEVKTLRKKTSRVEEENETLALQLKKMSNKAKANRQRSLERSGSLERQGSVEKGSLSRQGSQEKAPEEPIVEDLDPTELKIQLELNEQESQVLRRKIEDLESENERLQKEIKDIVSKVDPRRAKLQSGRSFEADMAKNEAMEKEFETLKSKFNELETENEKLMDDNKRLQMKTLKRLPCTTQENLYIDKQVLEEKVRRLEKKLKESTEKLKNAQSITANGEPPEKSSAGNTELICLRRDKDKLKTELSDKATEIGNLNKKISELEDTCKKLREDCDEMKVSSPYKERTPKKPKDTTPKTTLIKWVDELESECAKLHVKLKFMETEKQVLDEMCKGKRNSQNSIDGEMCHLLFSESENLKTENETLKQRTEAKESEVKLLKRKIRDLEHEKKETEAKMKEKEREEKAKSLSLSSGPRTSKRPTEMTTKIALRRMVQELDEECERLHSQLRDAEKKKGRPNSEDLSNLRDLEDKLEREKERNDELTRQLQEEREKQDKLMSDKLRAGKGSRHEEDLKMYKERVESLKKELAAERERFEEDKAKIAEGNLVGFEELRAAQTEKHRMQKELSSSQHSVQVLEKKLKEAEENLKYSEKSERNMKGTVDKLEKKLEEERGNLNVLEERNKDLSATWSRERENLKDELSEMKRSKDKAERELRASRREFESLDKKLTDEKNRMDYMETSSKRTLDKVKTLNSENQTLKDDLQSFKDKLEKLEKEKTSGTLKLKKESDQARKEKEDLEIRMNTLETEIKSERRRRERLEKDATLRDSRQKNDSEVNKLKEQLENTKSSYEEKMKNLAKELSEAQQERDDLQNKFELLEEDYVVQKAQYTTTNEDIHQNYETLKKDHETIESELRTLRDTYNLRQDTWIKEKLKMQERLQELDERVNKASGDSGWYAEKRRLINIADDRSMQIDVLKREMESVKDQCSYYRKEAEEYRRKVDDLEKLQELNDRRHTISNDTSAGHELMVKELRAKLAAAEKTHKTDMTKIKMKFDAKVKTLTEESTVVSHHMNKYRRERDTYKEMLDVAQKNLAEMKGGSTYRASRADAASEAQAHLAEVQDMQSQMTELEDKLADSRLEGTRLKNEIVDQKTNFEIQLADLQSKINEYEEDRLLGGGSRRIPGLRTRLELNWQKEREEQQRLIQETATLAKDLRQTLYEVERERDMERLEAKRKIEQLKKTVDIEHSDTKSKVQELQRDLLELREAHAKLRQINDKLRREKDRTAVEREAMRDRFLGSSREQLNQMTKMERLVDEMKKVKDLAPLVLGEGIDGKEGSLTNLPGDPKPKTKEEFTDTLRKLNRTTEEIKCMMNMSNDKDRLKRASSFRKALSEDSDDEGPPHRGRGRGLSKPGTPRGPRGQLYRKAQSLDHQMADDRGKIWVSTDAGSTSSIESGLTDDLRRAKYGRDASLDRMSTGSQTSDLDLTLEKKKKKAGGIKGVMSKLTKSKSIEDSDTGSLVIGAGLQALAPGVGDSGQDLEKETVKGKLKGIFKKGPPSRSQSVDRGTDREGPTKPRRLGSRQFDDTASIASNASIESSSSAYVPPVMRRFGGKAQFGSMTKASSLTVLGGSRQSSFETQV
ncbi:uncharacterized protein LOC143019563 isoform X3 [Oratosquilla oratoria]|uniref:uncharacterized protein LOC143019563 isoform X3 n=1 Tax=Oratosquilla oratoria TaxID=337810 RepID=UPI003F76CCD0